VTGQPVPVRVAGRAVMYRQAIADLEAAGRDREALAEAIRWLRAEAVDAARRRPGSASQLYRALADRIATLAASIPAAAAADPARRHQ
jgi:hypothetical protein